MSGTTSQILKICWLFPGSFHLFGERGNILALQHEGAALGWEVQVDRLEMSEFDRFDPGNYDMIVSPPCEIAALPPAISLLAAKKDLLLNWIQEGGVLLSTGINLGLWGHGIDRLDGSWLPGLGIADYSCQERANIVGDDLHVTYRGYDGTPRSIISHQIQRLNIFPGPDAEVWAEVRYGFGNQGISYPGPKQGPASAFGGREQMSHYHRTEEPDLTLVPVASGRNDEGIRLHNSLFTNLLGPVLFVDRQLLVELLHPIAEQKGFTMNLEALDWDEYRTAFAAREAYIKKKLDGSLYSE